MPRCSRRTRALRSCRGPSSSSRAARALVRARQDGAGDDAQRDLVRIRAALVDAGLRAFLAPVDAMLAR
jgi:hypothetical protein